VGASRNDDREETGSSRDDKAVHVSSMLTERLFLFFGTIFRYPLIRLFGVNVNSSDDSLVIPDGG
jgi:hypothetical protein